MAICYSLLVFLPGSNDESSVGGMPNEKQKLLVIPKESVERDLALDMAAEVKSLSIGWLDSLFLYS